MTRHRVKSLSQFWNELIWIGRTFLSSWLVHKAERIAPESLKDVHQQAFLIVGEEAAQQLRALQ